MNSDLSGVDGIEDEINAEKSGKKRVAAYESPEFLARVAKRMYEGVRWQDAVEAESPGALKDVCVRWKLKLPAALVVVQEAVDGADRVTVTRLKAEAARVLEAAGREEDLVKRATVLSKVSEVLGNCHKVAKESGRGEYEHMTLDQIQDKIARLLPKTKPADAS